MDIVAFRFVYFFLLIGSHQICYGDRFELLIYHSNNIFSHFEENNSGIGGAARALHILSKARREASERKGPPVLYLNAGDNFGGSSLYHAHKWRIVTEFTNMLKPDAMCLGNHDFDEGTANLTLFLRHVASPVVGANIDVGNERRLFGRIKPYHLFSIRNWTIGIIGYTTIKTKLSFPGVIDFTDEIEAVKRESRRLHNMGAQIIIALGHAGAAVDTRIAKEVPDIDIVVGAHRKTWARDGDIHSKVHPPQLFKRRDGKKVIIVYEPGYLTHLGMVKVRFDEDGDVDTYSGRPILLDAKIPQTDAALGLLKMRRKRHENEQLGITRVTLSGKCLAMECNLANLILDAICDHFARQTGNAKRWTEYPVAVINSGAFRKTINITTDDKSITNKDLVDIMHFNDYVCTMDITGRYLQQALEQGARWDGASTGELLQLAGLHVTYNFSRPKGGRISRIFARCGKCRIPKYEPLKRDNIYKLVTTYYVSQGIDGHTGISENKQNYVKQVAEVRQILKEYIEKYKTISPEMEDRFVITDRSRKVELIVELLFTTFILSELIKILY